MKRNREVSSDTLPEVNSIIRGEVASLQPYGVFVKIPGCEKNGLVHISQISNSRVERPEDVLELKEKIYCKVISVEEQKISLSMKVVNQTTGQDLDPNQIQTSKDEQHKKKGFKREFPKIELGAVFDTICKKCGGKGHLAQDCFCVPGGKKYDLLEEVFEWPKKIQEQEKHRKKEKKKKHKGKHKKEKSSKSEERKHKKKHLSSSDSEDKDKKKCQRHQDTSSSDSDGATNSDTEHKATLHRKTHSESKHQHSSPDRTTYTSKHTKDERQKRSRSPSSSHKDKIKKSKLN